ncbi:hypothetical protein Agub_g610, partial [Astrephomene gubernaculifera]
SGELWSWGGNRDGRLGYSGVDTQPTPRRVDFRGRAVAVAASNRHSACLTGAGEVWTWGANNEGQLGYGTSNSANNPTPRLVEAMKVRAGGGGEDGWQDKEEVRIGAAAPPLPPPAPTR